MRPSPRDVYESLAAAGYNVRNVVDQGREDTVLVLADRKAIAEGTSRVIIKIIRWQCAMDYHNALSELSIMQKACSTSEKSPWVVPLLDVVGGDKYVCMVLPYLEGGDLCRLLSAARTSLSKDEAKRYFKHMLHGLLHLKKHNIAHGDVSLENVALTSKRSMFRTTRAQLIDLGSAMVVKPGTSMYKFKGKAGYIPPELAHGDQQTHLAPLSNTNTRTNAPAHAHTRACGKDNNTRACVRNVEANTPTNTCDDGVDSYAVDVWCAGLCLYTMLTGRQLYASPQDASFHWLAHGYATQLIAHYDKTYGLKVDKSTREFICLLLNPDPSERPTVEELLRHPWVKGNRWG